jgi:cobalt-zinc-cadmium efflux system protein
MPLSHCNLPQANRARENAPHRQALLIAIILTGSYMVVEFAGGLFTNSLALMADAGHMLTDVAALALSTFALWFSSKPATEAKTYGFYRVEILAALVNGAALSLISCLIFYEAYQRFGNPPEVKSGIMLLIAVVGLVVNLLSAYSLHRAHLSNLNLKGAFLHILGDAFSSAGAIVAGVLMAAWRWYWADPLASVLVGIVILYNSWGLVRDAVDILLEGTPSHINLESVKKRLGEISGVTSIHDLHVWTLTSGIHAMSCHVSVNAEVDKNRVLQELSLLAKTSFKIDHTTFQLEETCLEQIE